MVTHSDLVTRIDSGLASNDNYLGMEVFLTHVRCEGISWSQEMGPTLVGFEVDLCRRLSAKWRDAIP